MVEGLIPPLHCLLLLDLQEQGAGSTVHPQSAGNAEGGEPMAPKGAPSPGFAGVFAEHSNLLVSWVHACLHACLLATAAAS